jgi:uncharacterized protein DUF1254
MKKILLSALLLLSASAFSSELVTINNFVRAESDMQMKAYVDTFKQFGKFHHSRAMYDVTKQLTIRPNTDTLYSFGIFDLSSPLSLKMPNTDRYQSAMVISQDHSAYALYQGDHTITEKKWVLATYSFLFVRL